MKFVKESVIKASPERVFAFHHLPDAFERLIPPWEKVKVVQKAERRVLFMCPERAKIATEDFGEFFEYPAGHQH